jgi:hypothetical protein
MAVVTVPSFDQGVGLPLPLLSAIAYPLYTIIYPLFFSSLSTIPGLWQTRISRLLEPKALKEQRQKMDPRSVREEPWRLGSANWIELSIIQSS